MALAGRAGGFRYSLGYGTTFKRPSIVSVLTSCLVSLFPDTPEVSPEMQGATQQLLAELDVDGIANNARRHEFAMLVVEKALDGIKTLAAEPTPSQHRAQDLLETIYTMADATQAVLNGDEARAEAGRRELARKVGMDLEDADEE